MLQDIYTLYIYISEHINIQLPGCRAIVARLLHDDSNLTVDGKLNAEKICDADPPLREVLNVGASWIWVPRPVFNHYAGLDAIAQASGNYLQSASKSEHDGQIIFKIIRQLEDKKDFEEIKAQVMKNRAKHIESLPGMFHFLRKYGSLNGKDMNIAKDTAAYIRGESNSARHVDADMWNRLAADIKGMKQHIRLRHGALAILYADSNKSALSPGDMKNLGSKDIQEKAIKLESAIEEMNNSVRAVHANDGEVLAELVRFSAACFALLVNKLRVDVISKIVDKYNIESDNLELGHLQWYLLEQVSAIKKCQNTDTVFADFALKVRSKDKTATDASGTELRNNSIDNTATLLEELGWKVGHNVQYKKEPAVYKITKFADGKVYLTATAVDKDKQETREAPATEFQCRLWKISKVPETQIVDAGVQMPHQTDEYTMNLVRSIGFFALHEAKAAQTSEDKCVIQLKPKKRVEVTENIPKGGLSIAPASFRIDVTAVSKCAEGCESFTGSSLFLGAVSVNDHDYNVFAAGVTSSVPKDKSQGMQAPFWAIDVVNKESEANCALTPSVVTGAKIKSDKIDSWLGSGLSTADVIKVPMIVSTKNLKKGDVLKVFVPNKKRKTQ